VAYSYPTVQTEPFKIPIDAASGIIIVLLAIIISFFWLEIFPQAEVLRPIK
jgi:hypothetical protein